MKFGKVIKLFLMDGTPNGRWMCELSNWTGIAYKIPRNMVKESENREELSAPGVYFYLVVMMKKINLSYISVKQKILLKD